MFTLRLGLDVLVVTLGVFALDVFVHLFGDFVFVGL